MNNSILERLAKLLPNMPLFNWNKQSAFGRLPNATPAMPKVRPPKNTSIEPKTPIELFREDLAHFAKDIQPYIEKGSITWESLTQVLDERKMNAYAALIPLLEQSYAAVEVRIEQTRNVLSPSQREIYAANVDRHALLKTEFRDAWHERDDSTKENAVPLNDARTHQLTTIADLMRGYNPYEPIWTIEALARVSGNDSLVALATQLEQRNGYMANGGSYGGLEYVESCLLQLALAYASKAPSNLQDLAEQHLADSAANRDEPFFLDDEFFQKLNEIKQYSDAEKSLALYNALSKTTGNALHVALAKWPMVCEMQADDLRGYKNQHILRFAAENIIGHSERLPLEKTLQLERLLSIEPGEGPKAAIKYKSLTEAIPVERLAKILLHTYSVEVATPIVQAYQGERALDGSLRPEDLVADVAPYLQTLLDASPQLQMGPKIEAPNAPITYGYTN